MNNLEQSQWRGSGLESGLHCRNYEVKGQQVKNFEAI